MHAYITNAHLQIYHCIICYSTVYSYIVPTRLCILQTAVSTFFFVYFKNGVANFRQVAVKLSMVCTILKSKIYYLFFCTHIVQTAEPNIYKLVCQCKTIKTRYYYVYSDSCILLFFFFCAQYVIYKLPNTLNLLVL